MILRLIPREKIQRKTPIHKGVHHAWQRFMAFAGIFLISTSHAKTPDKNGTSTETPAAIFTQPLLSASPTQKAAQASIGDKAPPQIKLVSPTAAKLSEMSPVKVVGQVSDNAGLDSMLVSLNGQTVPFVIEQQTSSNFVWKFNAEIQPVEGLNTLIINAQDAAGNMKERTHHFHFERRYFLEFSKQNFNDFDFPDHAGDVIITAGKPDDVRRATVNNAQGYAIKAGARVKLIASAKRGYQFEYWAYSGFTPVNSESLFREMILVMPEHDVRDITATFSSNRLMAKSDGEFEMMPQTRSNSIQVSGVIVPERGAPASRLNAGICHITLGRLTGAFSGKIQLGDKGMVSFAGETGNEFDNLWFKTRSGFQGHLDVHGRVVTMELSYSAIYVNVSLNGETQCQGTLTAPLYNSANPVPREMLVPEESFDVEFKRSGKRHPGYYTFYMNSGVPGFHHPWGTGFGAGMLSRSGNLRVVGTMPDGMTFLAAGGISEGDIFYDGQVGIHVPLSKARGHASADLLSGAIGVSGGQIFMSSRWFRDESSKWDASDFPNGWPGGMAMDGEGQLYDSSVPLQFKFAAPDPDPDPWEGNMSFTLSSGRSVADTYYFKVNRDSPRLLADSPRGFSIKFDRRTGRFNGTFIAGWREPSQTRRLFQGIIVGGMGIGFYYYRVPSAYDVDTGWVQVSP